MEKIRAAILGSRNIGTDLLFKLKRNSLLIPTVMTGIIPESDGLARARANEWATTAKGIDGLLELTNQFDIVFEATSAKVHKDPHPI